MRRVRLRQWRAWFSSAGSESYDIDWTEGMTAGMLVPHDLREARGLVIFVNSEVASSSRELNPGDFIDIAVRPGGPGITIVPLIAHSIWISTLVGVAAILALNFLIRAIIGKPKGPKNRGDEESPHSSWSGVQNVRVEGQPRQVVYGRFRVAPMIIDEFIVTYASPPTSVLYSLGMLSEGPVASIGGYTADNDVDTPLSTDDPANPIPKGIQVNGNALEGFRSVEAHVRMGTQGQAPIPGFEQLVVDYEVGAKLSQIETTSAAGQQTLNPDLDLIVHPYYSNSAESQQVWKDFGFSASLREKADAFTCLVDFPSGLCSVNTSTGDLENAMFQALARYRELDDNGDPIIAGGDNGDGWVYVYPEAPIFAATQKEFGKEFSGVFIDPGNYTPAQLGRALFFDGANDYATTNPGASDSMLQLPSGWGAGSDPAAGTFMGWTQFVGIPYGLSSSYRPIIELSDPANPTRGIALFLERQLRGPDGDQVFWLPTLYVGNGSAVHSISEPGSSRWNLHYVPSTNGGGTSEWHHFAVTYSYVGSTVHIVIYLDGQLAYSANFSFAAAGWRSAGKALEMGRSRTFHPGQGTPQYSHIRCDEWRVYQRALTTLEIQDDYFHGNGRYGSASTDLVAGWHFEESPGTTTFADFGDFHGITGPNDLYSNPNPNGPLTGAAGTGKVLTPGTGPVKRSRWQVEMLRLNKKGNSTTVVDESIFSIAMGKVSAQLAYPNIALLATKIRANDQLSGGRPTITELTDGILCPVWDGNSVNNPSITYQWTRNPAWIALDIATNKRYGRGADYDFFTVDLRSVKAWADYNDELVYDNRGHQQVIDESGSTSDIVDLRYDSTLFDGFGGIEILFRTSPTPIKVPPSRWIAGRFVGFSGIPPPSGAYAVDINETNISGFEIGNVEFTGGGWIVRVKFDKVTYGHPWTDGQFLATIIALSGTAKGKEPRFQYSWVHDTFKSVWDTLVDVAATARAMPFRDGKILRFKVEKPRTPVGIIGMAQIIPGTFEMDYVGAAARPNSYQVDFWDEDHNYERVPTSMDDPALPPSSNEEDINRESISIEGVTRRSQVLRDLYFRILVNRLLARSGKFESGLEMLPYEAGDVFQLSHDIVPWGKSGRLLATSTTTNLHLDRQVELKAGKTYHAKVRTSAQARATDGTITERYDTVLVTAAAGIYPADTAISIATLAFTPAVDDPYMIYADDEIVLVQISSVSLAEGTNRKVEWIDYDEAVYDCDVLPHDLVV